ncbi:MAG TPA: cytochrome P450 [Thermoleophilaceae bacterium]|nr:cytochrome P450 [Thermoleophilaceae bacterium]
MSAPAAMSHNPLRILARDVRTELAARGEFPPGETRFSLSRTRQMATDPLPLLLSCYERFGPVFTLRILHAPDVFVLGPEANRHVLLSNAANFHWREGGFRELEPLLGDGLLTIDGAYHRRARHIMLPAFHHAQVAAATAVMIEEAEQALDRWQPGQTLDVYAWARRLAMRIAMRALLGLDPDGGTGEVAAREFERALSFYGTEYPLRVLRGPGTPWRRMHDAREVLDEIVYGEIERRRGSSNDDILGMLMAATGEDGERLSDGEVRDQVATLLFAGHDTATSTISFLLYELARHPRELQALYDEQDQVLGGRAPTPEDLVESLPRLDMTLDETLRLYPPAWVGPRKAVEAFEVAGTRVPAGAFVNYCSWASHRLPDVFEDPETFNPERFTPERKAALPKGAYVPFGGGSRTCIGMRFGQMEVKAVATLLLQRFRCELLPGRTMTVRQMPTLSPRGGLEMTVRERALPAGAGAA